MSNGASDSTSPEIGHQAGSRVPGLPRWTWIVLALIAWAKLVLVSHDEIRALAYDSVGYLGMAAARYWGAPYDQWHFTRPPGYPLFVALGGSLGLPLRVWIELAWLASASLAARGLRAAGVGPWGCVLGFALLALHPTPTVVFGTVYADTLYTCGLVALVSSLGLALVGAGRGWCWATGTTGAIVANTRPESIVVYGLLAVGAALLALEWWRGRVAGRERALAPRSSQALWRRGAWAVALPLAIVFASEHAVRARTWLHTGAYVSHDLALPGLRSLYRALLSIPPESPSLRMPIPRAVRERAASASPAFAELSRVMETTPWLRHYSNAARDQLGVEGEFGAWTIWALYEASAMAGDWPRDARERDARLTRAAREIRAAQASGRLERRWAPFAFVPPEWGELARALPDAARACWRQVRRAPYTRTQAERLPQEEMALFDGVANRRTALLALQRGESPPGFSWIGPATVARIDAFKAALGRALPAFSWVALIVGLGGGSSGLIAVRRGRLPRGFVVLAALVWAAIVSRFALLMVLHAAGVDAQMRYTMPCAVLLAVALVLGLRGLLVWARPARSPYGISGSTSSASSDSDSCQPR